ncbi:hypothetical protein BDZ91DRAFT_263747 [Kalaharituber pfeilii]|nr:hypothetical protein BDZ91DRAFT_263747 [Kalaharituber pfeilii]
MPSNDTEIRTRLGSPPIINPRSSSLQANSGQINGQDHTKDSPEGDPLNSGSDGEKERVREKLKKTSIAGIRSESQSRESDESSAVGGLQVDQQPTENKQESDLKMGEPDDKSDMSDGSMSSQGSRKRSRDQDDNGEDAASDAASDADDDPTRPRAYARKRSRELSDEPEGKKSHDEGFVGATAGDDTMMESQDQSTEETYGDSTTPPATNMDEDTVHHINDASYTSPSRKLDGRKRVREEGDVDPEEKELKTKKTLLEEGADETKDQPREGLSENRGGEDMSETSTKVNDNESTSTQHTKSPTPEPAKIPPGSGFANTSARSPFATAAASAKPLFGGASTSTLFANSKFGAMSGSSASPFATLGSSSGSASPFGALSGSPKPSPFGTAGTGGFGGFGPKAPTSGFGALAANSTGDVISGAPRANRILGTTKPAKPFGAPDSDEDSGDEGGDDVESGDDEKAAKSDFGKAVKNDMFQETEVVTGEENEITICHYRAKTYHYDKNGPAWKERGIGTLKLNASKIDLHDLADNLGATPTEIKRKYRLIMRADAVHKVILNTPLTEALLPTYGDNGRPPAGSMFKLVGLEDGKEVMLMIKLRNPTDAKALYTHIVECLLGPEEAALRTVGEEL